MHAYIASGNGDLFTETKLVSGSGGLGAACMQNTYKRAPHLENILKQPHLGK